jgi:ATP-dependent helicase/DNAse subunit B
MKLDPIEPRTPEINPKDRGTIIHRIMELFYIHETENIFRFMRNEIDFEELTGKLEEYTNTSVGENAERVGTVHPALLTNFENRATTTCRQAIRLEIDLIGEMTFPLYPTYTELAFGRGATAPLTISSAPLEKAANITGVIDRVDVDEEHGTFSITDYKTGKTESVLSKIRKGEHLQLPLYIEATKQLFLQDKKVVGAFLFSLRTMRKMHGLARKDSKSFYFKKTNSRLFVDDEEWNDLMEIALSTAADYIHQIRNSNFSEKRDSCNRICDYREICRYGKK